MSRHPTPARGSATGSLPAAPKRGIEADWKRWHLADRLSAITIIATSIIVYGFSLLQALDG
jgi:hypothetical protein